MKILITGIPGSGKTTIGNYLRDRHGFFHVDMESDEDAGYQKIEKLLAGPVPFIENIISVSLNIVMTWGFVPGDRHIEIINMLKDKYGFKLIWFDGDREAARKAFTSRSTAKGKDSLKFSMEELNLQMLKIDSSNVIARISPQQVNTFDKRHNFKGLDKIVREFYRGKS